MTLQYRLNEDWLDDFDAVQDSGRSAQRLVDDELESDEVREYKYIITFTITALAKRRPLTWYIDRLRSFRNDFCDILDISRIIEDFSHKIIFHFGKQYGNSIADEIDGVKIRYMKPDGYKGMNTAEDVIGGSVYNNDIKFDLGVTADISSLRRFKRMLLDLSKAFTYSVKKSFKSGGNPYCFDYNGDRYNMLVYVQRDTAGIAKCDENMKRKFTGWYRAFFPEKMPKELNDEYDALRSSTASVLPKDVVEFLKRMNLHTEKAQVVYDENTKSIDVTLPKDYDMNWGYSHYKAHLIDNQLFPFKLRVHGGRTYKFHMSWDDKINDFEDVAVIKILRCCDGCDDICLSLYVYGGETGKQMNVRTFDFTKTFRNYNVRVVWNGKKVLGSAWFSKRGLHNGHITVIDSKGKKTYDYQYYD